MNLQPSYLDDPQFFASGTPRWAKHFYALILRGLGETFATSRGDMVRFATEHSEREEFPELEGVKTLVLSLDRTPCEAGIETVFFGVYIERGDGQRAVLAPYDEPAEALKSMDMFLADPTHIRLFEGKTPWVASMVEPGVKLDVDAMGDRREWCALVVPDHA